MTASIHLPRRLLIGGGAGAELGSVLSSLECRRALVVTDTYLYDSGVVDRVLGSLGSGIEAVVFADTVPDPTDDCVEAAADVLRSGDFDCVVGLGGGSPMDTAKAAAILAASGGRMRDYRTPRLTDTPGLPIIAIPTTAGSGSECTRFTVVTDTETNDKMLCAGLAFLPVAALVDYRLTLTMPPRLSADAGVDALTHAIEAYVSRRANPFADSLALPAMRTIYANVRRVYEDPDNHDARSAMMLAATQAGMAFSNSSVALIHGMSRPIGAHFHLAHGLSNAMLLPVVTEFSVDGAPDRYATCARVLGVASDDDSDAAACFALVTALTRLNEDLEVPNPQACGIPAAEWSALTSLMAEQALASGSPANNPRIPSAPEIEQLYTDVFAK
ncbi:iron-containing alcohol dehydrogenase (plasmid) [Embleya sp. NBC_00888]|uniref:iron-containing alcohol dehydrogenase n=1 Tax=Embleya sp. NBC_00888 TaxID=2975960 RepID=UPI002F9172FA|nr:iron-containing alcohol dehydrogenase [Embleya sp. NBC_00888]